MGTPHRSRAIARARTRSGHRPWSSCDGDCERRLSNLRRRQKPRRAASRCCGRGGSADRASCLVRRPRALSASGRTIRPRRRRAVPPAWAVRVDRTDAHAGRSADLRDVHVRTAAARDRTDVARSPARTGRAGTSVRWPRRLVLRGSIRTGSRRAVRRPPRREPMVVFRRKADGTELFPVVRHVGVVVGPAGNRHTES